MDDKDYIRFLLTRSTDINNRINATIEEILRKGEGKENVKNLIESIRYLTDDMERIVNR